jgi:SAM-dependent methyltransferase
VNDRQEGASVDPYVRFRDYFKIAGSLHLTACPVCDGAEIGEIWRLPQNRLAQTVYLDAPGSLMHKTYLNYLPTLQVPQRIFKFDICDRCESIFLNPKTDDQASYTTDASKVNSFRTRGPEEFRTHVNSYYSMLPENTKLVVDAACGAGQALCLMKQDRPEINSIGLELSTPSVEFMNGELGLTAHLADLDRDDLDPYVAPGTVDFVIFQEAFEHVRQPLVVMRKLVRMLRPGGRIHFTAQYYGDNPLQIRVGEPIYVNNVGLNYVVEALGVDLVDMKKDIKIRATVEKPA